MQNRIKSQTLIKNCLINKKQLKDLMYYAFRNYGIVKSSVIADKVKNLTFHYATKSGISLSIEDLRVPYKKRELIGLTNNEVQITRRKHDLGNITNVERFQKTIDIWNNANNFLKEEVLIYFRESDPLNPLYIMAFSGARGNISQVRQLVGMRGLMADPQGQIIDLPIRSNFREGLNVTEYIISSYGARKGLVDTALRTADSGYLTRRLVDVAQDIIVREEDCKTKESLSELDLFNGTKVNLSKLIGRILAEPLFTKNGILIASANTEINIELIEKIKNIEYENLKIRSPLTCKSIRSICKNCYGWHLSYSEKIQLGEAIGIIAAQSIGEPGTQLTMRTFHTGGVFSGDLTRQVRSPICGIAKYNTTSKAVLFRTLHGSTGFRVKEKLTIYIENSCGTKISFNVPPDSILLLNNDQKVYKNEIIAEIQKEANLIVEKDQKDIYSEKSGELFFQDVETQVYQDKQSDNSFIINNTSGLIWVLEAKLYLLPSFVVLQAKTGELLSKCNVLTDGHVLNKYAGIATFTDKNQDKINILHFANYFKNTTIKPNSKNEYTVTIISNKSINEFKLDVELNKVVKSGETIAILKDNSYRTKTGGIITYSLERQNNIKKKKNTKEIFSGYFYWIPEEAYELKNTFSFNLLKVKNGTFIKANTEILTNIFSKGNGLLQINEFEQQLTIKTGELFNLSNLKIETFDRSNRFVKPGEYIVPGKVIAQRLTYLEFFEIFDTEYLLARPVTTYFIPRKKSFSLEHVLFSNTPQKYLRLKIVKKIFYKNWEKITSSTELDLLQTYLVLEIKHNTNKLFPKLEIIKVENRRLLKLSLYEQINLNKFKTKAFNSGLRTFIRLNIKNNQYIYPNTIVAHIETSTKRKSILSSINLVGENKKEVLILTDKHVKRIPYSFTGNPLFVKTGDLVRSGTWLNSRFKSPYSGQVYKINHNSILIRLGKPYRISSGTILRVQNNSSIKKGDTLVTLVYEKLKTTDIVQGLPKVEEILEARKIKHDCLLAPVPGNAYFIPRLNSIKIVESNKNIITIPIKSGDKINFVNGSYVELSKPLTDGILSPHDKLETLFSYYRTKYSIDEACYLSFKQLQLFLVKEVQKTYNSQGVEISDKHIEIIVKQMTSKVCIENSGSTTFLPGEIISLQKIQTITKVAIENGENPPLYTPVLLGITKASLNSDSFISAASFQETTRVLTEAAIEGKKDWLNGLKENVIIGRLIPAGTGFNYNGNHEMLKREKNEIELNFNENVDQIKTNLLNSIID